MSGMKESTSREQILTKVRNALMEKTEIPYPDIDLTSDVLQPIDQPEGLEVVFAEELIKNKGQFIYCENEKQFADYLTALMQEKNWSHLWTTSQKVQSVLQATGISYSEDETQLDHPVVGITDCEKLIARSGSVLVSDLRSGRRANFAFPDIHLVMAYSSQVVPGIKRAIVDLRTGYDNQLPPQLTVISGPSRTADIEKTLVMGAHGPQQLIVFLIDDL